MLPEHRQALLFSLAVLCLSVGWQAYRELRGRPPEQVGTSVPPDELSLPIPAHDAALLPQLCISFENRVPTGAAVAPVAQQPTLGDCCTACRAQTFLPCNAFIYCTNKAGCYSSSQLVAGNITSLPYQACLLLYQGLSDPLTGRPVLTIPLQGFSGGAPITAIPMPVKGFEMKLSIGFFNRFNYVCEHPGRMTNHACMLRGTPEELAPLCQADPRCRVMVHHSHGWDYNWLNMTAFKGGWGVELKESDATVNNNVATYFKLSPPVPEPAKKAQSRGVLEGILVGAGFGLALVALAAAVLVPQQQQQQHPGREAGPAGAAVPQLAAAASAPSSGTGVPTAPSISSQGRAAPHSERQSIRSQEHLLQGEQHIPADPKALSTRQLVVDSAHECLLGSERGHLSGGRTAQWVARQPTGSHKGCSPSPSSDDSLRPALRTKTAPWLAPPQGRSSEGAEGSSRALTPSAAGISPPTSGNYTAPPQLPQAPGRPAAAPQQAAAPGPELSLLTAGSLATSSPFFTLRQAEASSSDSGSGSEGDKVEGVEGEQPGNVRRLQLRHADSMWGQGASAAALESPLTGRAAESAGQRSSGGGGGGGSSAGMQQERSGASHLQGDCNLGVPADQEAAAAEAEGPASQAPAGDAGTAMTHATHLTLPSTAEPILRSASAPCQPQNKRPEDAAHATSPRSAPAPAPPPAAEAAAAAAAAAVPAAAAAAAGPESSTGANVLGELQPGASWQRGVEAPQAVGSAQSWGKLGRAFSLQQPTAVQLLSQLPEVHWTDWIVDPGDIEFCCRPDGSYLELGAGAFGKVYRVVLHGAQPYAAKVLDLGLDNQHVQNIFLREASLLRRLRHRNVVGFQGVCILGGKGVLIMELMEGGDLFHRLQAPNKSHHRLFGWHQRGKRVALDVARGIHYLHSLHLTHFDVKASNVLLTRDLTAKLADVGFTRLMDQTHHSVRDSRTGTFDYMAPEILMGHTCNQSVDIYSFGILLWEICSGEHPLRGRNKDLRVPEDCPEEVADLIEHCTASDPAMRPTAREVVERVTQLQLGASDMQGARDGY